MNGWRDVSADSVLGVVVRGTESRKLADGGSVLLGQVLVHTVGEGIRLDNTLAGVAKRNLDELANCKYFCGILAAGDGFDGEVVAQGDLLVRAVLDGVVQSGTSVDADVGGGGVGQDARGAVGLAGLWGDDESLAHVHGDRDIGHGVIATNITNTTASGVGNLGNGRAIIIDSVSGPYLQCPQ